MEMWYSNLRLWCHLPYMKTLSLLGWVRPRITFSHWPKWLSKAPNSRRHTSGVKTSPNSSNHKQRGTLSLRLIRWFSRKRRNPYSPLKMRNALQSYSMQTQCQRNLRWTRKSSVSDRWPLLAINLYLHRHWILSVEQAKLVLNITK